MKAISLFAGAGGLDTGFEKAGFDIIWANEIDHDAAATWKANRAHADVMHEGDIADRLSSLSAYHGADIVFGGPPCQGFSVAGKMDASDPRSELIFTFLSAIELVRPRFFVMENVAALGRLDRWAKVREMYLSQACSLGYRVDYKIYHTADYGVPQKRDRVIFFGILDGRDPAGFFRQMEKMKEQAPTARQVLRSVGAYGSADNPPTCPAVITLARVPVMRKSPYAGMLVNGAGRPVDLDGLPPTLPASMGGNKTPIIDQRALNDACCENWFATYHKKLVAGEKPATVEVPNYIRRLTLKEAAAIQTFPEGYVFKGARNKQYRQIGNAVPTLFAYKVAQAILSAYNDRSRE